MPTNIEIKARVRDFKRLKELAETLSDTVCETIMQEDTFFNTTRGRLKLRVLAPDRGQLVYYERADASGPKASEYAIAETPDPDALRAVLATALGVRGVVRKERLLYLVGQTRVHLDQVEGLGSFMELEVMLQDGQSAVQGEAIAVALMEELGVESADLIEGAYIDLLEETPA